MSYLGLECIACADGLRKRWLHFFFLLTIIIRLQSFFSCAEMLQPVYVITITATELRVASLQQRHLPFGVFFSFQVLIFAACRGSRTAVRVLDEGLGTEDNTRGGAWPSLVPQNNGIVLDNNARRLEQWQLSVSNQMACICVPLGHVD